MRAKLVVAFVVIPLDGCVLDGAARAVDLSVGPWVVRISQTMFNPVALADHVEPQRPGIDSVPIPGLLCELDAVVSQDGVDTVGHRFQKVLQKLPSRLSVCLFYQLGHGELAGSANGYEEKELAVGGPEFSDVDIKIADWIPLELLSLRLVPMISGSREMPCRCKQRCNEDRVR